MKKITAFIFFYVIFSWMCFSQETLLTIDNNKISNTEFKRIYLKNSENKKPTEKDVNDYLNLFINFKLKVLEAENLGYDTTKAYKNEYNKYIYELAEPFFIDSLLQQKMLKEAYKRSQKEVRMSYILFVPKNGDTAEAYQRAENIYKRLQKGADFQKIAMQASDSKNKRFDKCDAWYNGVFMMPYKIENFAFEHKIGDISKPIRINNVYFILKITGTRQAPKKVRVEHIYVRLPKNPSKSDSISAMHLLDSIGKALKSGESFEAVAKKYSQDKVSAAKGGDLGWFSTGKMFRDFEKAAYSIKNIGDYVGPIRTPAGYHYIKLTGRKELGTFDQEKKELLSHLEKSQRYKLVMNSVINRLKKEYNFLQETPLKDFDKEIDSTIFIGKWSADKLKGNTKILSRFANEKISYDDFAKYLSKNQININKKNLAQQIAKKYSDYVAKRIKEYEITQLPAKNKDFKYLSQEYHDGLLLFDITNDMVWEKAIKDTLGLKKYYSENRNKYYQKLNLAIYSYSNEKVLRKTLRLLKLKEKRKYTDSMIVKIENKKGKKITLEQDGIFKPGDNAEVDYIVNLMKNNKITNKQKIVVDKKNKKIIYIKSNFSLIKGLVTADYQNILEDKWIKKLRKKYKITVNQEVFDKTKKELIKN